MSELSQRAQQLIDEANAERDISATLSPGFVSKAAAKANAPRKPLYTAEALVALMVEHPEYSHAQFADAFGYKASWFAAVLISPAFQAVLEPSRHLVSNPMLTGTMDDLLRATVVQSLTVLQERLDDPKASEDLIIKALNAGVKALGMGTAGMAPPPAPPEKPTLAGLADRLSKPKLIEATPARDWTIDNAVGGLPV